MKIFSKVAVVGTGLIGGSLALAIKKYGLAGEIIGVSRKQSSLNLALKNRAIDRGSRNLSVIRQADLVILATPVDTMIRLAPRIAASIKPGCIVTDVGSSKKEVVEILEKYFVNYVGGHPLAGSEKRGIANSRADIFKGTLCILTPTKKTRRQALVAVRKLWRALGARVAIFSPSQHDKILAFISHLPHAAAFSLMASVPSGYLPLATSGLKDTTRIAASDSLIWSEIFLTNRANLLEALAVLEKKLKQLKIALLQKDQPKLQAILSLAKNKRESLR